MQIGILQCGDVQSSLSPQFGEYPDMIKQAFADVKQPFDWRIFRAHEGELPECTNFCDGYLITGSHHSIFDDDELWINQLQQFVVRLTKSDIKTVGLSFGHMLIAEAMGGKVERTDNGWQIGIHQANILSPQDFMLPAAEYLNTIMLCEDHVNEVDAKAVVVASTKTCQNAIVRYDEHRLGIQCHPEFSKAFAKALLMVRQEEFPSKRFERANRSLAEQNVDRDILFRWIANFFNAD